MSSSSPPSKPLCLFFFKGHCRYGASCTFSHETSLSREEALKTIPCPFFQKGCCRYGKDCRYSHQVREEDDVVCGICLETPQQYGLLSCCNHVFCYKCVMNWRHSDSDTRLMCPTCREKSNYVVPSHIMARSEEQKEQILQDYKTRLSKIPCRRFDGNLGSCRFGRDCLYAHLSVDGTDTKPFDRSMQELHGKHTRTRNHHRDMLFMAEMTLLLGLMGRRARQEEGRDEDQSEDEEHNDDDNDDQSEEDSLEGAERAFDAMFYYMMHQAP